MLRTPLIALALTGAAALSGCAANRAHMATASAGQELDALRRSCDARGGILVLSGRISGRPALDNICRINNATSLPPRS